MLKYLQLFRITSYNVCYTKLLRLVDLLGYEKPDYLEGNSLSPLIKNPKAKWKYPAIVTYVQGCNSILQDKWNYILYNTAAPIIPKKCSVLIFAAIYELPTTYHGKVFPAKK